MSVTEKHIARNGNTNLFNDVGAELLYRERADIANELANDSVAESVIVQVKDVLNNLSF